MQLKKKNITDIDKSFSAIFDSIDKMKKFTSNLMDLTPIASKKEVVLFDKLLAEVIDYLKPQKRFQGVNIKLKKIEENIPFQADSTHIQQLLYNLFNNAADASVSCEKREIMVETAIDTDIDKFHVTIKDTGAGIDPELLPKLFNQKFTTKKHGHGFGLMVCKKIVDSHQGNLHVDSLPGKGTTFRISFPMVKEQSPQAVTA
jgi:two-component system sporulation sensor kinase A